MTKFTDSYVEGMLAVVTLDINLTYDQDYSPKSFHQASKPSTNLLCPILFHTLLLLLGTPKLFWCPSKSCLPYDFEFCKDDEELLSITV